MRYECIVVKILFRLVNGVVALLSETPLHRLFSHQVLVLRFNGRRSGKQYAIPVSFLSVEEDGGQILHCMTDRQGIWWKNLLQEGSIAISMKGQRHQVTPTVVTEDQQKLENALAAFCRNSAISAYFAGVKMHAGHPDPADLASAAAKHVLIQLSPDST